MNQAIQRLVKDLMALPLATRAMLAEKLVESVDSYADADIQRAWHAEITHRVDEYENGKVTALAAQRVADDVRHVLNEARRVSS